MHRLINPLQKKITAFDNLTGYMNYVETSYLGETGSYYVARLNPGWPFTSQHTDVYLKELF